MYLVRHAKNKHIMKKYSEDSLIATCAGLIIMLSMNLKNVCRQIAKPIV